MRLLGLDVGEARIGVAASDPTGTLASARTVVPRHPEAAALRALLRLIEEEDAQAIIVGLPRSLNGQLHSQAALVQAFAERLRSQISIPLYFWDERLSTVAAEREMRAAGTKRDRRRAIVDAVAATIILQHYLDAYHARGSLPPDALGAQPAPNEVGTQPAQKPPPAQEPS
jgi:putative Holliday junction resolvase